jgi:IclR helix-turn-helix domain
VLRVLLDLWWVWVDVVSQREVSLTLTAAQVAQVVADAMASGGEQALVLSSLEGIQPFRASPLLEDLKFSAALLRGLLVLTSFPPDGGERGSKQIAQELDMAVSTTHRYIRTLVAVGLLEQNQVTRQYRRVPRGGHGGKR